jgi:hypothetical protein
MVTILALCWLSVYFMYRAFCFDDLAASEVTSPDGQYVAVVYVGFCANSEGWVRATLAPVQPRRFFWFEPDRLTLIAPSDSDDSQPATDLARNVAPSWVADRVLVVDYAEFPPLGACHPGGDTDRLWRDVSVVYRCAIAPLTGG